MAEDHLQCLAYSDVAQLGKYYADNRPGDVGGMLVILCQNK